MSPPIVRPSPADVRAHRIAGHTPYRSWCSCCVRGSANYRVHSRREDAPVGACPEIHSDYAFFRNRRNDGSSVPVLVSVDRTTGCLAGHVVPQKGIGGGWIVQQHLRDLRKWGIRGKVLLRSDGEHAIVDLLDRVARLRGTDTLLERTPKSDSRSNGRAERAEQKLQKKVRVLKLATEINMGQKIPVDHPAFAWMVEHAADVVTKAEVGTDGLTAWERLKTRPHSGVMFEFGARVLYRVAHKPVGGEMEPRWQEGVWIGKRFASDEHVIAMESGQVARTGTVRPHPDGDFNLAMFNRIVGTPWSPSGRAEMVGAEREQPRAGDIPRTVEPPPAATTEASMPAVRRVLITRAYLEKFGYTLGCAKCRMLQEGDGNHPARGHNDNCRKRIEAALRSDPELSERLDRAEARQTEYLAKQVEAGNDPGSVDAPAEGHVPTRVSPPAASATPTPRSWAPWNPSRPDVEQEAPRESLVDGEEPCAKRRREDVLDEMPLPSAGEGAPAPDEDASPTHVRATTQDSTDAEAKRSRTVAHEAGDGEDPESPVDGPPMVGAVLTSSLSKVDRRGKYDVCEVFSPPRMVPVARESGLRGGWSLDIRHVDGKTSRTWDLASKQGRTDALELIRRDKPYFIMVCPPCT